MNFGVMIKFLWGAGVLLFVLFLRKMEFCWKCFMLFIGIWDNFHGHRNYFSWASKLFFVGIAVQNHGHGNLQRRATGFCQCPLGFITFAECLVGVSFNHRYQY